MGQEWILGGHLGGCYSSLGEVRGAWTRTEECNWGEVSQFEMYLGESIWTAGWMDGPFTNEGTLQLQRLWEEGKRKQKPRCGPGQFDMPVSTFQWSIRQQLEVWVCSSRDRPGESGKLANRW